jgi:AcrR family transcriptional regulator
MATTRAYRGVSAEDRRAIRRAALVAAAIDGLHEDGLSGISVRAVCARSELTPRYFYESFADLDELLVAAVDAVSEEVSARVVGALAVAPRDPGAQVRAAVRTGYGVIADDPRKASVFLVAAAGHGPLRARRQHYITEYADLVLDGLDVLSAPGAAGRAAARATALFLMGGTTDLMEAVLSGRLRMSRERAVDQLTGLWLGVLGVRPTAR